MIDQGCGVQEPYSPAWAAELSRIEELARKTLEGLK
jgi:hypothetical protein